MMKMVFLITSLFFLGAGYLLRTRRICIQDGSHGSPGRAPPSAGASSSTRTPCHVRMPSPLRTPSSYPVGPALSTAGWILFGLYWASHYHDYRDMGDSVNAAFSVAALPLFLILGYREMAESSNHPGSEQEGLRFLSGITVVAMTGYTVLSYIPSVELVLEFLNAYLASLFLTLTGFPAEAGSMDLAGNSPWFRSNDNLLSVPIIHRDRDEILITLSCTAFSSILLFLAAIITAREPTSRKLRTALIIIPAIFLFNVIRMAMIAYLTYTGTTSAAFAHHILGKAASLLALLFLAWVLLTFLPSIMDSISAVFDVLLPVRDRKAPRRRVAQGTPPPLDPAYRTTGPNGPHL